jgi:hypothetical protein
MRRPVDERAVAEKGGVTTGSHAPIHDLRSFGAQANFKGRMYPRKNVFHCIQACQNRGEACIQAMSGPGESGGAKPRLVPKEQPPR